MGPLPLSTAPAGPWPDVMVLGAMLLPGRAFEGSAAAGAEMTISDGSRSCHTGAAVGGTTIVTAATLASPAPP